MAHCTSCGAAMADGAGFCASCGAPRAAAPPPAGTVPPSVAPVPAGEPVAQQMSENVAGLLCYVLGWVTGLIFFFIDRRPFVRFHAAQSIVTFGGLHILYFIVGAVFGFSLFMGGLGGFTFGWALFGLLELVAFILWILLMIKAYQGERFRVPIAADLADKIFSKV